jgi:hypothetical protein
VDIKECYDGGTCRNEMLVEDLQEAARKAQSALQAVKPFASRWHQHMAQVIGSVYDRASDSAKFSLEETGFFRYIAEGHTLDKQVEEALVTLDEVL